MMLGLSLTEFTLLHVVISLIGIAAGLVFFVTLSAGRWLSLWNTLFLIFTILTSVTGFLFPPKPIGPPFIFGVVSLALLAISLYALFGRNLVRGWRITYLATALLAQWLNMVVLVVQSFQKVPTLNALAPTGSEPPVLLGQAIVLVLIIFFAWRTIPVRLAHATLR